MKFFSGFALENDEYLCKDYLIDSEFNVAGLSYGAIKAIEYAKTTTKRIDTIQLFSPAFFQDKSEKFKRTQLLYFSKDSDAYIKSFISNCFYPSKIDNMLKTKSAMKVELLELLEYSYNQNILKELKMRGIKIEVYLGSKDKIINTAHASEFFIKNCDVIYLNGKSHFLS